MTAQDLKNSILQLAVQGKLVSQDPSDEPASELLKRIFSDKKSNIRKKSVLVEKDDIPFDIPETWEWVRFGDLGQLKNGYAFKSAEYKSSGIQVVRISDLGEGKIESKNAVYYEESIALQQYLIPSNTFLICMTGSIGKMAWVRDSQPRYLNQRVGLFCPHSILNHSYLWKFLHSPYVINKWVKGKTSLNGNIKNSDITDLLCPIPPFAEQERIVAKIEELMPLIEEYGEAENRLSELNSEFPDKLRKSILQQAVQGKLTKRDPSDEPASELLKRIRAEKAKLITEGKIKKEKPLPPITDEEKPFDIPDTWEWERVGNLFSVIRGSSPRPKGSPLYWSQKETDFHWVTIKDISDHTQNGVMYKTHEYLTELGATLSTYVEKGELIVAVSGSTTGKFCVLGINGFIYDGLAAVLNPMKMISTEYLKVFYSWVYQILNSKKIGSAFPNINTDVLKNTLIPIPPLEEQKRIVARVEELLTVCDGLK